MIGPGLEVCFSPKLLATVGHKPDRNVVVVDILRATTAICTAFGYGLASAKAVVGKKDALEKKQQGWLVAGEHDGIKLPFADFGNSPVEFRSPLVKGKDIVFSTTNGTKAIHMGKAYGKVLLASFVNLETVCGWLHRDQKDVLILCSGWKNKFSLEDSIFAGAMANILVNAYGFIPESDSAFASMALFDQSTKNIMKMASRSSHYLRLMTIEGRKGLKYCFFPEKFAVIPVLGEDGITDIAL